MACWDDISASRSSGAAPVATCATAARACAPRSVSRQTIRTRAPIFASSTAVTKPIPLLAPVMRTVFPCMTSRPHRSALHHEHIDEIAVRVPKQHRPVAPRLIGWRLNPFADAFLEPRVMRVDILHLEIEHERPIGAGGEDPLAINLSRGCARDREAFARSLLELNIAAADNLGGRPG